MQMDNDNYCGREKAQKNSVEKFAKKFKKRNPDRIKLILNALEKYWNEKPDLRLIQLLYSLNQKEPATDLFYLDDDIIAKNLGIEIKLYD